MQDSFTNKKLKEEGKRTLPDNIQTFKINQKRRSNYYDRPRHKFTPETHPVVAVDMDNTIWTEDFPNVGVPFPHAIQTVNKMLEVGYEVILWTARGGDNLDVCLAELERLGLDINHPMFTVNDHAKYNTDRYPVQSPKANSHVYLDDKAYGAPDFSRHWHILHEEFIGYPVD